MFILVPQLKDILKELYTKVAVKWEDIGIMLGLESGMLEALKTQENKPESQLREMLKLWIKQVHPQPTWSAIVDALESVGEGALAGQLNEKYVYCNTAS